METTVSLSVMIQIYVVFPNTMDRQIWRSSILSSCCDVCHLYSLARKTWAVQIYVQRLQGMNVPINNSYSDNQRKRSCQLPDFHLVWNWRIHFATGEGKSTLVFNIGFFLPFVSWRNHPSVPQGRTDGWQGAISTRLHILSQQQPRRWNITAFCHRPVVWCFLQAHDGWHLCWQVSCESSIPCLQLCFNHSLGTEGPCDPVKILCIFLCMLNDQQPFMHVLVFWLSQLPDSLCWST